MDTIKRCTKCILPENIPGIKYDERGVCNFCNSYDNLFSNWDAVSKKKEETFKEILFDAKKLKRPYDCLIPLSGGKDSTYTLYVASKIYNLNCLAVTFDNGYMSDQAKINIKNAIERTNTDHIFYHLDKEKSINLFKIFLTRTGGFCNACMRGINYSIENAVKQYRIPLIIKGSGRRVQYVSQTGLGSSNTALFFKNVVNEEPNQHQYTHFYSSTMTYEFYKTGEMLLKFLKVPPPKMMRIMPLFIGIYDYLYKPYPEIISIITKEMGWSKKDEKFEHLDCEFHNIPFYIQTLKLENITTETLHNSGLIRQGILTREEALKNEAQLVNSDPPKELEVLLQRMNLNYDDFIYSVKSQKNLVFVPFREKILGKLYKRYILKDQ